MPLGARVAAAPDDLAAEELALEAAVEAGREAELAEELPEARALLALLERDEEVELAGEATEDRDLEQMRGRLGPNCRSRFVVKGR